MLNPSVEVRNEGGVLVAEFWDCLRLDPAPVRELRTHYEAHVKAKGRPDVVVDLNGIAFAGSASLGGFLALHRLTLQHKGKVIFCNVDEDVFEVFRISKLAPIFAFVKDRAAAFELIDRPAEAPSVSEASGPSSVTPPPPAVPRPDGPLKRNRKAD